MGDLWSLDTQSLKWTVLTPEDGASPAARWNHVAGLIHHGMIVFGGEVDEGKPTADVWLFSFEKNTWRRMATAEGSEGPAPRHSAASLVIGKKLLVHGGRGVDGRVYDDLWMFDSDANEWIVLDHSEASGETPARYGHTLSLVDGRVLLFGGSDGQERKADVWEFELDTCMWSHVAIKGLAPRPRSFHSAVAYEHILLVYGGRAARVLGDLWEFNTLTETWRKWTIGSKIKSRSPMTNILTPSPRSSSSATLFTGNRIVVWSGASDGGLLNDGVWWLNTGDPMRVRAEREALATPGKKTPAGASTKARQLEHEADGDVYEPHSSRSAAGGGVGETPTRTPTRTPTSSRGLRSTRSASAVSSLDRNISADVQASLSGSGRDVEETTERLTALIHSLNDAALTMIAEDRKARQASIDQLRTTTDNLQSRIVVERDAREQDVAEVRKDLVDAHANAGRLVDDVQQLVVAERDCRATAIGDVVTSLESHVGQLQDRDGELEDMVRSQTSQLSSAHGKLDERVSTLAERLATEARERASTLRAVQSYADEKFAQLETRVGEEARAGEDRLRAALVTAADEAAKVRKAALEALGNEMRSSENALRQAVNERVDALATTLDDVLGRMQRFDDAVARTPVGSPVRVTASPAARQSPGGVGSPSSVASPYRTNELRKSILSDVDNLVHRAVADVVRSVEDVRKAQSHQHTQLEAAVATLAGDMDDRLRTMEAALGRDHEATLARLMAIEDRCDSSASDAVVQQLLNRVATLESAVATVSVRPAASSSPSRSPSSAADPNAQRRQAEQKAALRRKEELLTAKLLALETQKAEREADIRELRSRLERERRTSAAAKAREEEQLVELQRRADHELQQERDAYVADADEHEIEYEEEEEEEEKDEHEAEDAAPAAVHAQQSISEFARKSPQAVSVSRSTVSTGNQPAVLVSVPSPPRTAERLPAGARPHDVPASVPSAAAQHRPLSQSKSATFTGGQGKPNWRMHHHAPAQQQQQQQQPQQQQQQQQVYSQQGHRSLAMSYSASAAQPQGQPGATRTSQTSAGRMIGQQPYGARVLPHQAFGGGRPGFF